jgi:signal recognition particle subunit SRP54
MLDTLTKRIAGVFAGLGRRGRLSESDVNEALREVRVALLEADVNFQVAKRFIASIKEKATGEEVYASLNAEQTIIKIVRDELVALLGGEPVRFQWSPSPPTVVVLCGLQGSGKTTTAAKLARSLQKEGKKVMLAACDVQRPAAVHQLEVLGGQIGVPVYARKDGAHPVQIAREAKERAKYLLQDVLIVDTAGRLQIDTSLMDELQAVHREVAPTETLLVLDATTGQESVNVAQAFHERVPLTGAIFTKLDGDTRGGAVLSVREATGVPVRYVGTGESVEALDAFVPQRVAERILGMGDVLGIIERVQEAVEKEDVERLQAQARRGQVDFSTLLDQIRMMRKMGPLKNIVKMIPGLGAQLTEEQLGQVDERQVDRIEAMVLSMTPQERANPDILNASRKRRIAAGSGHQVEDLNRLIRQLEDMRKQMKQLSKVGRALQRRRR